MVGAMSVVGNNLKFTNLKMIGFGTKGPRECFVLSIHVWPTVPGSSGNVLIENCTLYNFGTDQQTVGISTEIGARFGRPSGVPDIDRFTVFACQDDTVEALLAADPKLPDHTANLPLPARIAMHAKRCKT